MSPLQIGILVGSAALAGRVRSGRVLAILGVSTAVVFWLQPAEPIQALAFWLPFATVGLVAVSWILTAPPDARGLDKNWHAVTVIAGACLLANALQFAAPSVATLPLPIRVARAAFGLAAIAMVVLVAGLALSRRAWALAILFTAIVVVFTVLKSSSLAGALVSWLQSLRAATPAAAESSAPLSWLGFSYVAFRLLHTIRDRQTGRLPAITLAEYACYVLFFPAFIAGPIDRAERFVQDLRTPLRLEPADWVEAVRRITFGLLKKFVIADTLAAISISDTLAASVHSSGWMWVMLYAFAFRIYCDFSGYTDVAIGMGRILGIRLPENFAAPYLKPNIAQFWNSWHMSLTQWFRSYVFNPLARWMRKATWRPPEWVAVLVAQVVTMVLIGLWHGISVSFAVWGLWHAAGLFIHNRWSEAMRSAVERWTQAPLLRGMSKGLGALLTFHFVAIGWLFFQLSSPARAWTTLLRLFGAAGWGLQ